MQLSDNKFASNAFKLIDECTGEIIDYQCFKDWGRRVFEFDYCLPRYAKYKFVVLDEYGKSFWSPYSEKDGKYTLTVDGVKIAIERDCKGSSPVRFGDGCDVPPPPPPPKDGGGMGDPHIKSWNGKW